MEIHVSRDNESIGKFDEKSIRDTKPILLFLFFRKYSFMKKIKEWKSLGSEFPEQSSNDEFVGIKVMVTRICLLIVTPFLELLTANLDYNEILDFSEITEE